MPAADSFRFNHVHVFCSDIDATERWFVDGVGAEFVARRDSNGIPATTLRLGGVQILLRPARANESLVPNNQRQYGTDHFGFDVDDVDGAVAELKARGVFVEVEPWDFTPQARIAYIKGPDEVRIELVQRRP